MKREQATFERLEALCDYLEQTGVLDPDWRQALKEVDEHHRGHELRQRAREGRGPPEWAAARGRGNQSDDTGASDVPGNSGNSGESN